MTTTTNVSTINLDKMTAAQFAAATKDTSHLYVITDGADYMDANASNATNTAKALMAEASMPGEMGTMLTFGASGTEYTAPSNGWFSLYVTGCSGTGIAELQNQTTASGMFGNQFCFYDSWGTAKIFLPVKSGDVVRLYYLGTFSIKYLYFIAAKGG